MPRVLRTTNRELYSIETINKLLSNKYVLISSKYVINNIMNYYYQYNLVETGEDTYSYVYGFPVRKSLNIKLKTKLRKM